VGGGWLVAGTGKLALGCVLALGVGTGCIALNLGTHTAPVKRHRLHARTGAHSADFKSSGQVVAHVEPPPSTVTTSSPTPAAARLTPGGKASREFGPEGALSANASSVATTTQKTLAHTSSTAPSAQSSGATEFSSSSASSSSSGANTSAARAAAREFSPG